MLGRKKYKMTAKKNQQTAMKKKLSSVVLILLPGTKQGNRENIFNSNGTSKIYFGLRANLFATYIRLNIRYQYNMLEIVLIETKGVALPFHGSKYIRKDRNYCHPWLR